MDTKTSSTKRGILKEVDKEMDSWSWLKVLQIVGIMRYKRKRNIESNEIRENSEVRVTITSQIELHSIT